MKRETLTTVEAVITADTTTKHEHRERILAACRAETPARREMVTVREAAEILDVHPRTVQRYEREGLLHATRITKRRVRYAKDEVLRLATEGAAT